MVIEFSIEGRGLRIRFTRVPILKVTVVTDPLSDLTEDTPLIARPLLSQSDYGVTVSQLFV